MGPWRREEWPICEAARPKNTLKRPLSTSFAWLYLGRQKLKLSPFISLLRQELAKRLLANASQKSLLKLTKKNSRTAAKYLDHIWMQYGIQSLQLPLATFQKVIMQHRTSINFLLRPFLKSRHTSRNLGKIMEQSIKQALPENDFSTKEIDHVWKITIVVLKEIITNQRE